MPTSFTTTLTPIVPLAPTTIADVNAIFPQKYPSSPLSLPRYAYLIGYDEYSFFGVSSPFNNNTYECSQVWNKFQRDSVERAIQEAAGTLEGLLNFFLNPKWIVAEEHPYSPKIVTKKKLLIETGIMKVTVIEASATVNHASDPATVTVVYAGTDLSLIHVYYPGLSQEIIPSNIVKVGGNAVIYIPRSRLVEYSKQNNPVEGLDYFDPLNFQNTVDVKTVENDSASQLSFVSYSGECYVCTEEISSGCLKIESKRLGILNTVRENVSQCISTTPYYALINYVSGLNSLTAREESMLLRLTHALMPTEPCGCDITQRLWARDRNVPKVLTKDRLDCPFGFSDGAWSAYVIASDLLIADGGYL